MFINNKTRYFFDGIKKFNFNNFLIYFIKPLFNILFKTLYLFELNYLKNKIVNFYFIFYENLSVDLLCVLSLFKYKYPFIKLKSVFSKKRNNDIESTFLFSKQNLENSNFCLLLNINLRFENTSLNLKLKQRNNKGNFQLLSVSSCFNSADFYILGSNIKIMKLISKGTHPVCQLIANEKSPYILINSKLLKLNITKFIYFLILYLKKFINYLQFNILNWSIYEPGINLINNLTNNNNKLVLNFSSIQLLSVLSFQYNFINYIFNVNLFYLTKQINLLLIKKVCLLQNYYVNYLYINKNIKYINYFYLPTKTFFEKTEIFYNTEGLVKKSTKLFDNYKTISCWKLLRTVFNKLNEKIIGILHKKFNFLLNFSLKTKLNFLKFIYLLYLGKNIVNTNYLINNINLFTLNLRNIVYFYKMKFYNFKLKFWVNDFYFSNRDNFSKNSSIIVKCSKVIRFETTNFF